MAETPNVRGAARARAVADLPIDALVSRGQDLAREWTIALIRERPLERMGDIPLEALAREAPELCAQALRAMQSEPELNRLTGEGVASGREDSARARGLFAATGAADARAGSEAVEALRGVLWEALLDELRGPPARLVADAADRLGYVCARMLAAAITAAGQATGASAPEETEEHPRTPDRRQREAPVLLDAVLIDEHADVQVPVGRASAPDGARHASEPPARTDERPLAWDESPPVPPLRRRHEAPSPPARSAAPPAPEIGGGGEIEIRDERPESGPAAWIGSIGRQLARFEHEGVPFAALLVELLEIDSIRHGESTSELAGLSDRVEEAIERELSAMRSGSVTCESPGRYWLLVAVTDRSDGQRLAERISLAVPSSVSHRQAPVEVVVGVAICPDDGLQAPALAAHADVGLYAARSAARILSGRSAT